MSRTSNRDAAATQVTERRRITASGLWIALSLVAPMIASGALSVVIGRVLGSDLLGEQSLIAFGSSLLASVVVSSLNGASIQAMASRRDDPRNTASTRWVVGAHAAAGLVVGLLLSGYGILHGHFAIAWAVVGLSGLLDAIAWGFAAMVIARTGWSAVARSRLVAQLSAIALGVGAVVGHLGITGVFAANCVASAGLLVWLWHRAPPVARPTLRVPVAVVRLWGVFVLDAVLSQIVAKRIEFLFLAAYSQASEIAAYSIAVALVSVAVALPASLASAAMPSIAAAMGSGNEDRAHHALASAVRVTAVCSLPLAAAVATGGPAAVVGLYGDEFARAADLVPLASLGAIVFPVAQLCANYWAAVGRLRWLLVAGAAGGLIDLGVAFWLVPTHGASGAIIASLGGQTVTAVGIALSTWAAAGRFDWGLRGWLATAMATAGSAAAARACVDAVGGLPGAFLGSVVFLALFCGGALLLARLGAPLLDAPDVAWLGGLLPERLGRGAAWAMSRGHGRRSAAR